MSVQVVRTMTLGEFRELTKDEPDDTGLVISVEGLWHPVREAHIGLTEYSAGPGLPVQKVVREVRLG